MSIFSKLGEVFGGVWDKISSIVPLLQSFVRVPMSEQNAADFARAGVALENLGNALVAQGRIFQEVVLESSEGGDAVTLGEAERIIEKAKIVGEEAADAVEALKAVVEGVDL